MLTVRYLRQLIEGLPDTTPIVIPTTSARDIHHSPRMAYVARLVPWAPGFVWRAAQAGVDALDPADAVEVVVIDVGAR